MTQEGALKLFRAEKGHRDCIAYLEEKAYDVNQIELLVLSHVHFDRMLILTHPYILMDSLICRLVSFYLALRCALTIQRES